MCSTVYAVQFFTRGGGKIECLVFWHFKRMYNIYLNTRQFFIKIKTCLVCIVLLKTALAISVLLQACLNVQWSVNTSSKECGGSYDFEEASASPPHPRVTLKLQNSMKLHTARQKNSPLWRSSALCWGWFVDSHRLGRLQSKNTSKNIIFKN